MKIFRFTFLALLVAAVALSQTPPLSPSYVDGAANALMFAYGITGSGVGPLVINQGNTATGSQTITLDYGNTSTHDGIPFTPVSTTTPLLVGGPGNQETVTPSAVSCATPSVYQSCQITATFANTHGRGEQVRSGSYGLQEAINWFSVPASAPSTSGVVVLPREWRTAGGTNTKITAVVSATPMVWIEDLSVNAPVWYGKSNNSTGAYSSTNNDMSFSLTLAAGTATKTLSQTYNNGPACVVSGVSGTLTGILKVTTTGSAVTVADSVSEAPTVNVNCRLQE